MGGINGKSFLLRCGTALVATAGGFLLRLLLNPLLGGESPFITFFPAVALAAVYGGFRAGFLTTIFSAVVVDYFLMTPQYSLTPLRPKDTTQLIFFFTMGVFISWAIGERGRIRTKLQQAETEAERQTEALRESEEKSRLAQKYTNLGIWDWDLKTNAVEWSEGVYHLLGLKPNERKATVENWLEFVLPEDLAAAQAKIQKAITEGREEFYDEFRIRRAGDGEIRWIATQGQIMRGGKRPEEEKEAVRLLGVNYDITERKNSELQIKNLNQELNIRIKELQAIFDIAPVGIAFAQDASCDVITANPALAAMVGVAPGENVSTNKSNDRRLPYKHFQNGRELAPHELPMQRAVAEKRPILNEEIDILRADGKLITIYGYAAPILDENGSVASCVAVQIDITERKKNEIERERKLDAEQSLRLQAEEANRLKDEFLATVSHELRTPLNSIIGWIKLLRDGHLPEEARRHALEAIARGTRAQSQLIEDLLDVSRIISGKLQLEVQPVNLISVINSALETVRPAARAKEIELRTDLNPQVGLISGDFDRLQQIVWNLLSNAIKFTPGGGRVEVILQPSGAETEIVVRDNGKGINPEFLPFVFDRFRQADGSITRKFSGLGLGLSIVRHLVELHGGTVAVESAGEGKGASFSVKLPSIPTLDFGGDDEQTKINANGFEPSAAAAAAADAYPQMDGARILVVDDEADTREILKMVFERCRARVETAASAAEGFEKVKAWRPQVIVSDIGMPDEDGYAFIKKVRNWERETGAQNAIASIALTAYARSEDRLQALVSGYQMHVAKPVEPFELASKVAALIIDGGKS
jgi:PAS domain S-box-containing protein